MVRWELETRKQMGADTMMEIKAALDFWQVKSEQTSENAWVRREILTMRYELLLILLQTVSSCSRFQQRIQFQLINQNNQNYSHQSYSFIQYPTNQTRSEMDRVTRILEKDLSMPHSYAELKLNPFPYLRDCNRMQIFQFIHQLEQQNKTLKQSISNNFLGQSIQDVLKEHQKLRLRQEMLKINLESIDNIETQLKIKQSLLDELRDRNIKTAKIAQQLEADIPQTQKRLMQVECQRQQLQFQLKMHQKNQQNIDPASVIKNLYTEVKNILETSL